MNTSRSEILALPGCDMHVRRWGDPAAPSLFLLHGWMDVSASFQFVVDELAGAWSIVAPDWRGFGPSGWRGRSYFFAEHLGDLDAVVERYSPQAPVRLVGHSMGGILASLYAGIRPERVAGLVSLEGFGIAPSPPEMAPERLRSWLDALREPPRMRRYPDRDSFARRLLHDNPFLTAERAAFLSRYLAVEDGDGVVWNGDPWHKAPAPYLFRLEESMAVWRRIQAPTLWVAGRESWLVREFAGRPGDWEARRDCFRQVSESWIERAGHMLHHDQPAEVARLVEAFFTI